MRSKPTYSFYILYLWGLLISWADATAMCGGIPTEIISFETDTCEFGSAEGIPGALLSIRKMKSIKMSDYRDYLHPISSVRRHGGARMSYFYRSSDPSICSKLKGRQIKAETPLCCDVDPPEGLCKLAQVPIEDLSTIQKYAASVLFFSVEGQSEEAIEASRRAAERNKVLEFQDPVTGDPVKMCLRNNMWVRCSEASE